MNRCIVTLATLTCIAIGCARVPAGDSWLLVVAGDTITVHEAGAHWDSLSPGDRRVFDQSVDLKGDFVQAFSSSHLIRNELDRLDYAGHPAIERRRIAYARIRMMNALQDSILSASTRSITGGDIAFFLDNLDKTVRFTISDPAGEQSCGPALLPELPEEMAMALLSLETGETAGLPDGRSIRLDSLGLSDPESISQTLADTAGARSFALLRLSQGRASEELDSLLGALWIRAGTDFRPSAFSRISAFYRGEIDLIAEDTLMTGPIGTWTASDMVEEMAYEATMHQIEPSDSNWIASYAKVIANRCNLAGEFVRRYPADTDLLLADAGDWALESAAESLYHDFVTDSVQVTEAQIDSAYLASPPTIEEKRSIQTVVVPPDRLTEFEEAVSGGTMLRIAGTFEGLYSMGVQGSSIQISPPYFINQVPAGMGEAVFALSDTMTWLGPEPLSSDSNADLLAVRLVEVFPERIAGREEATAALSGSIRAVLMERRLEAWLESLGDSFGLRIDEDLLESLPDDPGAWSDI